MAHKLDYTRPRPPVVTQQVTMHTCWAATALSWIRADAERAKLYEEIAGIASVEDLVNFFSDHTTEKGGLRKSGFPSLFTLLSMEMSFIGRASRLSARQLQSMLRKQGYVYLMIAGGTGELQLPNSLGHAVLVYGMDHFWRPDPKVAAMDPFPGLGGYVVRRLSVYRSTNEVILAAYKEDAVNPSAKQVEEKTKQAQSN